jgi:3-dehydroquinate synthase
MKIVSVELDERRYLIHIGSGARLDPELLRLCQGRQVALVSDARVGALYAAELMANLSVAGRCLHVTLDASEATKSWTTVEHLLTTLLINKFERSSLLIALGGGVIGDIVGFAAAIYQRGIDFIQMPTTLLAMVDSSVGGKTGINHALGKNMIGAFYQPKAVFADIDFLRSLSPREVAAGLAEIIKHGAIADPAYLEQVAESLNAIRANDASVVSQVVSRSCEIKAAVVGGDEREAGNRAVLNFGHTFGHAIEAGMGYGNWLHGEAVGAGMVMAADLSVRMGSLKPADRQQLVEVIQQANLPTTAPNWSVERYVELMSTDKKSDQGTPKFVVLEGLGQATLRHAPVDLVHQTITATTK